jgi:hypothetical protein
MNTRLVTVGLLVIVVLIGIGYAIESRKLKVERANASTGKGVDLAAVGKVCGPPDDDAHAPNKDKSAEIRMLAYHRYGLTLLYSTPLTKSDGQFTYSNDDWHLFRAQSWPDGKELPEESVRSKMKCLF